MAGCLVGSLRILFMNNSTLKYYNLLGLSKEEHSDFRESIHDAFPERNFQTLHN